ncbi:MAG: DNA/RNA non-specific endonuclease [Cyanobacteria bacterium P01_C01_bin.89]
MASFLRFLGVGVGRSRLVLVGLALTTALLTSGCKDELITFLEAVNEEINRETQNTTTDADSSEHLQLGNPSDAIADPTSADNYLLSSPEYALSYSKSRGTANWASWKLDRSWLGPAKRDNDFRADERLPVGWYQVDGNDYRGSGYDRGHLVPSADRTRTQDVNSNTFFMTNIIPQTRDNNRETWRRMEEYCRRLVERGYDVYLVAGVYGGSKKIADGRVTVPKQTWKVAIAVEAGANPKSVSPGDALVFAVDIPNTNRLSNNWRRYQLSIDDLEARTNLDFFELLPDGLENAVESQNVEAPRF